MKETRKRASVRLAVLCATLAVCCLLGLAYPRISAGRAAGGYTAEKLAGGPPAEISAAVREVLANNGIRVQGPTGVLCDLWLRSAVPAQTNPSTDLGISFGQIAEGTLVGVVRFPAEVTDFRQQHVKPGVYTLRYALNPVNGNHQGVAAQRDFLLVSPAADDQAAAALPLNDLLKLSRKASGTGHPSVWSLEPVKGQPPALPAITHQDDGDLWVVEFQINIVGPSNALMVRTVGLVVVGHAPEA